MSTPAASTAAHYDIDSAHSGAGFKVRHMMIAHVKGEFTKVSGTVDFDPANPAASKVDVTIDAASIHTREPQRDGHLRSADFLDVEKFPTITFRSTEVVGAGKDAYEVVGDLTIHGVTQQIALQVDSVTTEAKDPWGNLRRGAAASVTINRKDFGLHYNSPLETGGFLIGDDVHITIDVEMVRKAG
jgi:polyisoprenoid-binding protein YceI